MKIHNNHKIQFMIKSMTYNDMQQVQHHKMIHGHYWNAKHNFETSEL